MVIENCAGTPRFEPLLGRNKTWTPHGTSELHSEMLTRVSYRILRFTFNGKQNMSSFLVTGGLKKLPNHKFSQYFTDFGDQGICNSKCTRILVACRTAKISDTLSL